MGEREGGVEKRGKEKWRGGEEGKEGGEGEQYVKELDKLTTLITRQ